ncbi:hypothetical protein GUY60_21090 [Streptomyces sp. YC537]|uniref:TipAS antibiotic-recognition domain-containing protein n=1 Tax=Streptomyces boluensis TaxID=1775135 RepID=A0A964XN61_9ACTN|nr:hypothetical protein [Streptomyces boluensis]
MRGRWRYGARPDGEAGVAVAAAAASADVEPVQAEVDTQYRGLSEMRTPSAEEYRAIGRACVNNEVWRTAYESIAPGLAEYQRQAIEAYANRLR